MILVTVPAYNEGRVLEKNVLALKNFLDKNIHQKYRIIVANARSTDNTELIAKKLEKKTKGKIRYARTKAGFKGGKLKEITLKNDADYYAFIDADLPIPFSQFLEIINAVVKGNADIAIASRYLKGSKSTRPKSRIMASKAFNFLARLFLGIRSSDISAGAKCWNKRVRNETWPLIKDEHFFTDAELMYYTAKNRHKLKEIAVTYTDMRGDSKVNVLEDGMLMGLAILKFWFEKTFKSGK